MADAPIRRLEARIKRLEGIVKDMQEKPKKPLEKQTLVKNKTDAK